jgi:cytoskeleton protein RodZ
MVESELPESGLFPQSVGERLRIMRETAGLDLNDVGTKTRIPLRHLEAIERGDYASLPSPTYALGFTRSYARAVGGDEQALIVQLREDLGREDPATHSMPYEPTDPTRVPSRLLAWTAAALALALAIGYWTWRSNYWGPDDITPVPSETPAAPPPDVVATNPAPAAPIAAAPATGEVILTATAPVWLRIYDASKTKLFEKEMAVGESYTVPANANNPMILTGRPDGLKITVGGREVAPLGTAEKSIKDVGVSAAALAARPPAAVPIAPLVPAPAAMGPLPPTPAQ